jgi:hypothetical protein
VLSVTLDREDVEAVALRVVELLEERAAAPAADLVDYVYAHAEELGGVQIGSGSRPRWRFSLGHPAFCSSGRRSGQSAIGSVARIEPQRTRRSKRSTGTSVDLLPIRGVSGV